jgi:serine/threonine-protein kinase
MKDRDDDETIDFGPDLGPRLGDERALEQLGLGAQDRFEAGEVVAEGGMGSVRRIVDHQLGRVIVRKVLKQGLPISARRRFFVEAQVTAQLQHPGIVPLYDQGVLPDGRPWYTMPEVAGRTLSVAIAEAHAAGLRGVQVRRLVDALRQASLAVAYAHQRGVLHRDLKPDNIMVGEFGEVLVLDWGLAKVLSEVELDAEPVALDPADSWSTRVGSVTGTPAYMAPEQARGDVDRIDFRTDVYALGAILYEVLAGRRPYVGVSGEAVRQAVLLGPPDALDSSLPRELRGACECAMAPEPDRRFPTARALADALEAWLDGSRKRELAQALVVRADATLPRVKALEQRARALREHASVLLAQIPPEAGESEKAAGWAADDEAAALEAEARLLGVERAQLLQGALTHAPSLPEAHAALASDYRARHAAAEVEGAAPGRARAAQAEVHLRSHVAALPFGHPDRVRGEAYLEGAGRLTLHTDPPGVLVRVQQYIPRHRRLVLDDAVELGRTPIDDAPLAMGSYLCTLRHPETGHATRYPVHISRERHWTGVRPGAPRPHPVRVLAFAPDPDACFVPAGWFTAGDRGAFAAAPPGQQWCDAFLIHRFPVTNRHYIAFLDDLVAAGRAEEALGWAPRAMAGAAGERGGLIYGRDHSGGFVPQADAEGDVWRLDGPVVMIDRAGAMAYAAWLAARTGRPWRLPWDLEWEKAARGVDGRTFPWGDEVDPSYAWYRDSQRVLAGPLDVDSRPIDVSPYGVRGLGGNVRDWCVDVWINPLVSSDDAIVRPYTTTSGPLDRVRYVNRGGGWLATQGNMRSAYRNGNVAGARYANLGFRLVCPVAAESVPG